MTLVPLRRPLCYIACDSIVAAPISALSRTRLDIAATDRISPIATTTTCSHVITKIKGTPRVTF
jgi:hypothetical protein